MTCIADTTHEARPDANGQKTVSFSFEVYNDLMTYSVGIYHHTAARDPLNNPIRRLGLVGRELVWAQSRCAILE